MALPKPHEYQTIQSGGRFVPGNPGGGRPRKAMLQEAKELIERHMPPARLVNAVGSMFDIVEDKEEKAGDRIKAFQVVVDLFLKDGAPMSNFRDHYSRKPTKRPAADAIFEELASRDAGDEGEEEEPVIEAEPTD